LPLTIGCGLVSRCNSVSCLASICGAPSTADTTAFAATAITVRAAKLELVNTGHSTDEGNLMTSAAAASGDATSTTFPLPLTGAIAAASFCRSSTRTSPLAGPLAVGVHPDIPLCQPDCRTPPPRLAEDRKFLVARRRDLIS